MKQCGVVTGLEGKYAKVVMKRHSSCGSCNACKMGQEDAQLEIKVFNEVDAKVGQRVSVNMNDTDVLSAAFIVYVMPLLALLGGIIIGNLVLTLLGVVEYKDLYLAIIGFVTMAVTFLLIKRREDKFKNNRKLIPVIDAVVAEDDI